MIREGLTFDDLVCVPNHSRLESRDEVDIRTYVGSIPLSIPVLSSPMDSVTGSSMAKFMGANGGIGIIHRYMSIDDQSDEVSDVKSAGYRVGAAVGVNGDSWERTKHLVEVGVDLICLDVAHGDTEAAISRVEKIASEFGHRVVVMSANICTPSAARRCIAAGASVLRIGVGGGSACTTRVVTGVGVPQATAVNDIHETVVGMGCRDEITLVSDGGIRSSGDAVKALALGADAVMLGGLLAPFPVSCAPEVYIPTDQKSKLGDLFKAWYASNRSRATDVLSKGVQEIDFGTKVVKKKLFRGMASRSAREELGDSDFLVEGEEFFVDIDYSFETTFSQFILGIKGGLAYLGCSDIRSSRGSVQFMKVTGNGALEGTAHMRYRIDDKM